MQKLTFVLGLAISLSACGGVTLNEASDPAFGVAKQAAQETRDAATQEAEPAPAEPVALTLAELMADPEERMDQAMTVSAVYVAHEPGPELTHVTIATSTDEGADSLRCSMVDGSAVEGLAPGTALQVQGTLVTTEDATPALQDCLRVEADAAPAAEEGDDAGAPDDAAPE